MVFQMSRNLRIAKTVRTLKKKVLLRIGRANFRQHKEKVKVNRKKKGGKPWQKKEPLCQISTCVGHKQKIKL